MSSEKSKPSPKLGAPAGSQPSAADAKADAKTTGRVNFDDRGNAIWEWSITTGAFSCDISTQRLQKIENGLSLADDAPTPVDTVRANPLGPRKGYDPYDSGKLGKRPPPIKKDLRKLGEFFKLKRQAAAIKRGEE